MESEGRKLHEQAAEAREKGEFVDSLSLGDQALLAYDRDNDGLGFAEVIANRGITLKVYAGIHESRRILTLAKYELMGAVEIARQSGDKKALALPQYRLAQMHEELDELSEAAAIYKEALHNMEQNPPERHDRPSVLADMRVHVATCEYKAGDKSALERLESALSDLEGSEEDKYNKDVWVSGGYMRMADILRDDDPAKAQQSLQKAKEIIGANPDLALRKKQWDQLSASFK